MNYNATNFGFFYFSVLKKTEKHKWKMVKMKISEIFISTIFGAFKTSKVFDFQNAILGGGLGGASS